jgi:hypothetical protein
VIIVVRAIGPCRRAWRAHSRLPGCHGGGATPDAAISDAISALREWAAQMASQYRQHAQRQKSSLAPKTTRMWPLAKAQYSSR